MRDFADARHRLRDWVSICGTRLDRDRRTRQTTWPGERPEESGGEVSIVGRQSNFEAFVRTDGRRRQAAEAVADDALRRARHRARPAGAGASVAGRGARAQRGAA